MSTSGRLSNHVQDDDEDEDEGAGGRKRKKASRFIDDIADVDDEEEEEEADVSTQHGRQSLGFVASQACTSYSSSSR